MDAFLVAIQSVWTDSGYVALNMGNITMIVVGLILLYLAIGKGYEPLLLTPIAFGCVLANFPNNGFHEGVMWAIGQGIQMEIFPPLIFLGVGAMTDFGPLIANPNTLMLGAAAQFGIFVALGGAMLLGFNVQEAASIGIIGGADGPTAIYLATKLAPDLLGAIAVAAYSYMSLVPLIQPPIMRLFTTKEERAIKMGQLREVTRFERIVFPIMATIIISLLLPPIASLIGMLMLGNLFRESGVTDRLSDTSQNALCNIVTIFLGLVAFAGGTAAGVLLGKVMCKLSGGKINPLIGSAGVSAVPMAARVSQIEGQKANPSNYLLMHAMGPNVAGVIGTAVAAGTMLAMFGG